MASLLEPGFPCFALRTYTAKYLQSVYRKKEGISCIEASVDSVVGNARARFVVEQSKEQKGLVHVRCCYNNKYWVAVRDSSSGGRWIIGTTDEREEDLSSPSCTLFEPKEAMARGSVGVSFRHPRLGEYACWIAFDESAPYLYLMTDLIDNGEYTSFFYVLGLSEQKELPRYVAFKNSNGKYLGVRTGEQIARAFSANWSIFKINPIIDLWGKILIPSYTQMLAFHTEDIGDEGVICTVFTNDEGTVRIKSNTAGFWGREQPNDIIHPNGRESTITSDTSFKVVNGNGFVALQNLGNNKFCKTFSDHYLSASDGSVPHDAQLTVHEPVLARKIYDVEFHLLEARIYNTQIFKQDNDSHVNNTDKEIKATFSFKTKIEVATKWETVLTSKSGSESSIGIGLKDTPIIVNGEVKLSTESSSSDGKGTTTTQEEETTLSQEVIVSPWSTTVVHLIATRSSCDVPYSYKKKITLTTGVDVPYTTHDDGICTVANNYNFKIITAKESEMKRTMDAVTSTFS